MPRKRVSVATAGLADCTGGAREGLLGRVQGKERQGAGFQVGGSGRKQVGVRW